MSVLVLVFICVGLGVIGQLAMKRGMNEVGLIGIKDFFTSKVFQIILQEYVLIGMVFYVLAALVWLVILSQEELSFAYPLISIAYVITTILSKLLFNESLTIFRFFGILLICGGVYMIVLKI